MFLVCAGVGAYYIYQNWIKKPKRAKRQNADQTLQHQQRTYQQKAQYQQRAGYPQTAQQRPPPPPPPQAQPPSKQARRYKIDMGRNHLFLTEDVDETFRTFKQIMDGGNPGLCLTNRFPDNIREDYGIDRARLIWFSETAQGDDILNPRRLDFEVTRSTVNFIKKNEEAVILIDGLDYLILVNGFENVSTFLKKITDVASMAHATLVVIVRPDALSAEKVSYLKGQFDRVV